MIKISISEDLLVISRLLQALHTYLIVQLCTLLSWRLDFIFIPVANTFIGGMKVTTPSITLVT